MIDPLISMLRALGIDAQQLQPIAEGITYLHLNPARADNLWLDFRQAAVETGYWPLLTTRHDILWLVEHLRQEPLTSAARAIEAIEQVDPLAWLHEQGRSDQFYRYPASVWPDDRWCDDVLAHHDQEFRTHLAVLGEEFEDADPDGTTAEWQRSLQWAAEEHTDVGVRGYDALVLIPSAVGWAIPLMLAFGSSRSPTPVVHSALMKRWSEHYGADLRALASDFVELRAGCRPATRCEALKLAWEHQQYGPASDAYPPLTYCAAGLLRSDRWWFWWD